MAQGLCTQMVSPTAVEKYGEDWKRHSVGTGPFMLKEWIPGERVLLAEKSPLLWTSRVM